MKSEHFILTSRTVVRATIFLCLILMTATPLAADTPAVGEIKKLTASDAFWNDQLGNAVAISGETIVVGAFGDNNYKGSAYVFTRDQGGAGNWGQLKKLTASDGVSNDAFGMDVAIDGDTIVVGASSHNGKGAAYVFDRDQDGAGNWGEVKKLTAADGAAGDEFGSFVAISGDTIVIGAYFVGDMQGAAYVFNRDQGGANNWGQVKKLTASDGGWGDFFGFSVTVSGNTIVVGAQGDNVGSGSAYIFERDLGGPDNWGQVKKVTADDGAARDYFGVSVALSGDTLVVGAYGDNGHQGAAYLFNRDQGGTDNWGQVRKLAATDGAAGDLFGSAVAISGDTVFIGAYNAAESQGAAYVFARDQGGAGNWGEVKKVAPTPASVDDYPMLGIDVGVSGDFLVAGAPGENEYKGVAYVYESLACTFPIAAAGEGDLNDAIACFNAQTTPGTYQITLTDDIDLTATTTPINNPTADIALLLEGGGFTVDGQHNSGVRPFSINADTEATFQNLIVTGGSAFFGPGGLSNWGTLKVVNSMISGNVTEDYGGGIQSGGTLVLVNSTVNGNTASFDGGGLHNLGSLVFINSTLSGNTATRGGGIANSYEASLAMINSTVSGNTGVYEGGGLYNHGTTSLANSIIANSITGGNCINDGGTINAQNSLIEDGLACVNGTTVANKTGDPNLGPLQDNGGPTQTHALLAGSVAIDAGDNALAMDQNNNPLTTDQRGAGFARILGGTVDMGAYEVQTLDPCPDVPGNLLQNYCFEEGRSPWHFHTNGKGTFFTSNINPYQGRFAADVYINEAGSNVQLYQKDITLKPDTAYELSFAAYSSNGRDLRVVVHEHDDDYTGYGLSETFDLTTGWQFFQTTFTTTGFDADVNDARLRFWLAPYDVTGMTYHIDWVVLREVDAANPPIPPEPPVIVPPPGQCIPNPDNLIANPGYENGTTGWKFYTDGVGSFTTVSRDPYECASNAKVLINTPGSNVQLYQKDIRLQGGEDYRLRLAARSSAGQDVQLFVHKHDAPYTNYGLNGVTLNLTSDWQVFVVDFTAKGDVLLDDARLRIWLAPFDQKDVVFEFDDIVLLPLSKMATSTWAPTERAQRLDKVADEGLFHRTAGVPASEVLVQGYFLDGDIAGLLAGGYVPENGQLWCHAARPSRDTLLPANGKMAKVNIVGLGRPQNVTITGIWQDEPVGPEADARYQGAVAWLRSERDDAADGRVYHIDFEASYKGGVVCPYSVVVTVPVDRHTEVIDNGRNYQSDGRP